MLSACISFFTSARDDSASFEDQVGPSIVKQRAEKLRDIDLKKKTSFYRNCLEKEFQVLAESWHSQKKGMMKGISDNYLPVVFPTSQDSRNQIIPVRMERVENNMLIGSAT